MMIEEPKKAVGRHSHTREAGHSPMELRRAQSILSLPSLLWLLGLATVVLFITLGTYTTGLEPSIPAIQLTFDEAAFKAMLAQWRPSDVARFKMHFAIDFPFLLSYGLLGYLGSKHTSILKTLSARAKSLLSWTLPAAALMDASENLFHLYFLYTPTGIPSGLFLAAGLVATCKWLLIAAFVIGAGYASLRRLC